ncbi:MAG: tetratricopeptide repeat protein [Bradymonadaceae bacterium]
MSDLPRPTPPSSNVARLSPTVWHVFAGSVLVLFTLLAYGPSLDGGWIADDPILIVQNTCTHGIENIPSIIRQEAGSCNYRPLRYISYAIDHSIWGLNPWGYRLTNLLIHFGSIILVYLLLLRLGLSRLGALFAAMLFALHPVQADAVAYISGRRDVLTGFWFFAAMLAAAYLRAPLTRNNALHNAALLLICMISGALSIFSKEMGVTIAPVVILFLLFGGASAIRSGEAGFSQLKKRIVPLIIVGIPLLLAAGHMTLDRGIRRPVSTMANSLFGGTLESHIATVLAVHGRYVEMIFFPLRLPGDYSPPAIHIPDSVFELAPLLGAAWLLVLTGAAFFFARKSWWREAFGLSWYIITMLPVSHIIPHHELAAEHYLYIPIFGLLLTIASLLERLFTRIAQGDKLRRVALVVASLLILTMLARTLARSVDFLDEYSHAAATVRYVPESVRGHARVGMDLLNQDRYDDALPHLHFVLSTEFQGTSRTDALRALGIYYAENGNYPAAVRLLDEYMAFGPKNLAVIRALGMAHFRMGNLEAAHNIHKLIAQEAPDSATDHFNVALTAFQLQRADEAYAALQATLERDPTHLDALLMAALLLSNGDKTAALSYYKKASAVINTTTEPVSKQQRRLFKELTRVLEASNSEATAGDED